jgi:peptide/nickel transport system permease protein
MAAGAVSPDSTAAPAETRALRFRYGLRAPRIGRGNVVAWASLGIIVVVALAAILAPLLAPFPPNAIDLQHVLAPPGEGHPLGTDSVGRDLLSRLLYGARVSLLGPLLVVAISTTAGVVMGVAAGYLGGRTDAVLARSWDIFLAFPSVLLAIVAIAAFGPSFLTASLALAIVYSPIMARMVRGLVLSESSRTYVTALHTLGYSRARVGLLHILPNISTGVIAQATLNFGFALLDLAGLSFIGLGVQPPTADWGTMLAEGRANILVSSAGVLVPAVAIIVTVLAFNLLGDALGDRLSRR